MRGEVDDDQQEIGQPILITEVLSCISDHNCTLEKFGFATYKTGWITWHAVDFDLATHSIDQIRKAVVNSVLQNNSLLSISLDIRDNHDQNFLTAEDEATIHGTYAISYM